jgi:hypothetical protein
LLVELEVENCEGLVFVENKRLVKENWGIMRLNLEERNNQKGYF